MFGRQRKKQEGQQRHQYKVANKYVFKCRLKVDSDNDDVTNDGKLFHAWAVATAKAVWLASFYDASRPLDSACQELHHHVTVQYCQVIS